MAWYVQVLIGLGVWFVVSVITGLLVGRALRRHLGDGTLP